MKSKNDCSSNLPVYHDRSLSFKMLLGIERHFYLIRFNLQPAMSKLHTNNPVLPNYDIRSDLLIAEPFYNRVVYVLFWICRGNRTPCSVLYVNLLS